MILLAELVQLAVTVSAERVFELKAAHIWPKLNVVEPKAPVSISFVQVKDGLVTEILVGSADVPFMKRVVNIRRLPPVVDMLVLKVVTPDPVVVTGVTSEPSELKASTTKERELAADRRIDLTKVPTKLNPAVKPLFVNLVNREENESVAEIKDFEIVFGAAPTKLTDAVRDWANT